MPGIFDRAASYLDRAAEEAFYPEILSPLEEAFIAIDDPLGYLSRENLNKLDIAELHKVLERIEDNKKTALQLIRKIVHGKIAQAAAMIRSIQGTREEQRANEDKEGLIQTILEKYEDNC